MRQSDYINWRDVVCRKMVNSNVQRRLEHVDIGHCTKVVFVDEHLRYIEAKLQKGLAVVLFGHAPFVLCGVGGHLPLVALTGTQLAFLALQQVEGAFANCATTLGHGTLKANIETAFSGGLS